MTIEEQLADLQSQVEATNSKNSELLKELRIAKNKNKELDFDTYNKVLEENDTLKSQVSKLTNDLGLKTKDFENIANKLNEKESYLKNLTLENSLNEHLLKAGVKEALFPAVKALLKGQATVTDDNSIMFNDKTITDFMTEWSSSDGKVYIDAPINNGGGAMGSDGKGANVSGNLAGSKAEQEAYIKAKFNL